MLRETADVRGKNFRGKQVNSFSITDHWTLWQYNLNLNYPNGMKDLSLFRKMKWSVIRCQNTLYYDNRQWPTVVYWMLDTQNCFYTRKKILSASCFQYFSWACRNIYFLNRLQLRSLSIVLEHCFLQRGLLYLAQVRAFIQEYFSGEPKSIVMLTFLLFSDEILRRPKVPEGEGQTAWGKYSSHCPYFCFAQLKLISTELHDMFTWMNTCWI